MNQKALDIAAQVKAMQQNRFSSIKDVNGNYRGNWGSLEQARNFGLFVMASLGHGGAKTRCTELGIQLKQMEEKGMSEAANTSGGALVPTEFIPNLIVLLEKYGTFRRNAQNWPMATDTSIAAARTGGLVVYAPGAGNAPTQSNPGFKNVGLQARKMMTLTAIDSELNEDSAIAIGEVVGDAIADSFGEMEDLCGFFGNGKAEHFNFIGLLTAIEGLSNDLTKVMAVRIQGTAGKWSAITEEDLLALPGLLLNKADNADCKFYSHRNFYYTVALRAMLKLGGTNASEAINTAYGRNPLFLGRPAEFSSVFARDTATSDHWPCIMGNLKMSSLLGDRRAMTIDQSREAFFTTDQIGIRGTQRIAIANHGIGTLTTETKPQPGAVAALRADIA
jgi:HK97 family phage major capsid protein